MRSGARALLWSVGLVASAGPLRAQPIGPELVVNTYTTGQQHHPAIAAQPGGGFVTVWESGITHALEAQRFAASGAPVGSEFPIGSGYMSSMAAATGSYVVVWQSFSGDISLKRLAADGSALGVAFRANEETTGNQSNPVVSVDRSGGFVVAWQDGSGRDGDGAGIFARRFTSSGSPLGSDFRVNTSTTGQQTEPAVAYDNVGGFTVVWQGDGDGDLTGIYGQRYTSSGTPVGGEFHINSYTYGYEEQPSLAFDPNGNGLVVWNEPKPGGGPYTVAGQRLAPDGSFVGPEFLIGTGTLGNQIFSRIAFGRGGAFLVVWWYGDKVENAMTVYDVQARFFGPDGAPLSPQDFRINSYTTASDYQVAVAGDGSGNFDVVWSGQMDFSFNPDFDILARRVVQPPLPITPELRVNTITSDQQFFPRVSEDSAGNFVVVWSKEISILDFDVSAQRYDALGTPLGGEFRVNTTTAGNQGPADVAAFPNGGFVVVWSDYGGADGNGAGVFGQRYTSGGARAGSEFRVNTANAGAQKSPAVASDGAGNFVVVWAGQDGSSYGVFGQRYASSGGPLGPEFPINTTTASAQQAPSVAADPSGDFVVAWESDVQDGSGYGVYARRYASSGSPLGSEFIVNSYTGGDQRRPQVRADGTGAFVVVFESVGTDSSGAAVAARRFTSSGGAIGPQFLVNTYTTGAQSAPAISMKADGSYVVTWQSTQDGDFLGVFAQAYAKTGEPVGTEFLVNTYTTGDQKTPAVAYGKSWVVAWESAFQDGSGDGIYERVFQLPCAGGDASGDGAIDVADVFYLINYLFAGGPSPSCSGDVNGDGNVDVADVFYLINYLFAGGPPPI